MCVFVLEDFPVGRDAEVKGNDIILTLDRSRLVCVFVSYFEMKHVLKV